MDDVKGSICLVYDDDLRVHARGNITSPYYLTFVPLGWIWEGAWSGAWSVWGKRNDV